MPTTAAFSETVELLRRAQAGERSCLDRVLERYRERLLLRVRLMMGGKARRVAESGDFLQGVFVKILENFERFELRDETAFLRWATQIARNNIRDDLCRRREVALDSLVSESGWWESPDPGEDTPSQAAERAEQVQRLVDELAAFDETQRSVIELRHFEQLPFSEIGQRLGRSANAAQLLHTRALLRLNERMQDSSEG